MVSRLAGSKVAGSKVAAPSWAALGWAALPLLAFFAHSTVATAEEPYCEPPPEPLERVLIGSFVDGDAVPDLIESVRISFEVFEPTAGVEELYDLKVFSAEVADPPSETTLLTSEIVIVNTQDPIPPDSVWIEVPPTHMQWVKVPLAHPLEPEPDIAGIIYTVEMSLEQLSSDLLGLYMSEAPEPEGNHFSVDGGCSWAQLTRESLDILLGETPEESSTYIRIRVRP